MSRKKPFGLEHVLHPALQLGKEVLRKLGKGGSKGRRQAVTWLRAVLQGRRGPVGPQAVTRAVVSLSLL